MNKNCSISSRNRKLRSLLLLVFLFLLATIIPPVVAEVSAPPSIVQTQSDPSQLVLQAKELYQEQQYQSALPLWQSAAEEYQKIGDNVNQAISLSNLSLTHQQLGQWEDGRKAIATSLKLLKSQPDNSLILAQTLDIKGKLARETGNFNKAIESWQQAENIYLKLDNNAVLTQNNLNQAKALQDLGLYPRACKRILSTLSLDNISTCPQLIQLTNEELTSKLKPITAKLDLTKTSTLRNLGNLLLIVGQPQQSKTVLSATLNSAEKLYAPEELSLTHLTLGNTYQALAKGEEIRSKRRQYEKQGLSTYGKAIALSTSDVTKVKAQINKLHFLIQQEEWKEAESLWNSLYPEITTNRGLNRENIYASINYVHNLIEVIVEDHQDLQIPDTADLKQIINNATQQAQSLGEKRVEARAWGILGKLEEISGEYTAAESDTKKALNLVSSYDAADITYQYFWQLGRIQKEQQDIPKAIASYTKSYDALQSLRNDIATINPEVQFDFRDEVEPVYRELVELDIKYAQTLEKTGNKDDSKVRLIQARDIVESLQIAQLNNFFREACIDANPQVIDEIDPSAAVVYPIVLKDELAILLSLPKKKPSLYQTSISQAELEAKVEGIKNNLLTAIVPTESLLPQYQEVYNWIVRPLEAELSQNKVKTIAFVLDGSLRNIPMSVLHDGEKYLVEKYALALTPGLQLLNPKPLTNLKLDAIAGGISEIRQDFAPHENFGNLPKVPEELATIKKTGLTESSLLNSQFTKKALKQNIIASGSPIVHLATHAKFSSKAEDTFILSWDGQINIKELDDLLRDDTFNRKNDIELLVLSACETASGDPRATLGLAGVAVQAGARSTLATLWSVVDESTAKLMGEFYNELQKSLNTKANKAEVLRQAQLALINDEEFNHPHFWSSFILVGNWQ